MIFSKCVKKQEKFFRTFVQQVKNDQKTTKTKPNSNLHYQKSQDVMEIYETKKITIDDLKTFSHYLKLSFKFGKTNKEMFEEVKSIKSEFVPYIFLSHLFYAKCQYDEVVKYYNLIDIEKRTPKITNLYLSSLIKLERVDEIFELLKHDLQKPPEPNTQADLHLLMERKGVSTLKRFLLEFGQQSVLAINPLFFIPVIEEAKTLEEIQEILPSVEKIISKSNFVISKLITKLFLFENYDLATSLFFKYEKKGLNIDVYLILFTQNLIEGNYEKSMEIFQSFNKKEWEDKWTKCSFFLSQILSLQLEQLSFLLYENTRTNDPKDKDIFLNILFNDNLTDEQHRIIFTDLINYQIEDSWRYIFIFHYCIYFSECNDVFKKAIKIIKERKIKVSLFQVESCLSLYKNSKASFFEGISEFNIEKDEKFPIFISKHIKDIPKKDLLKIVDDLIEKNEEN